MKRSRNLDTMSALDLVELMNREDAKVPTAVKGALRRIATAIDVIAERLASGGRLIYVGSGTSGRIGAMDAAECPPTFNTDPRLVQYVIAGGPKALGSAIESEEDSTVLGRRDIAAQKLGKRDVVVGLSASGRTPYTIAAIEHARKKGTFTIAVTCTLGSRLAQAAELAIEIATGPEVLSGSTRLKAATAQKMVCNMLTTGAMARLGYTYGDLMASARTNNIKLRARAIDTLMQSTAVSREKAANALKAARMRVPLALVILKTGVSKHEAEKRLKAAQGNVRKAIHGDVQV